MCIEISGKFITWQPLTEEIFQVDVVNASNPVEIDLGEHKIARQ
jgi:hypothetical protein